MPAVSHIIAPGLVALSMLLPQYEPDDLSSFGGQNAMDKQYICLLIADIRSNFCLEINVR